MNRNITLTLIAVLVAVAAAMKAGGTPSALAQGSVITVHDAWVRLPAGARKETGVFAVVENSGPMRRAIVSASAEVAEKVELHSMTMKGAMMQMTPVKEINVPARGKVELRPGSFHVMLFGLKKPLAIGETVTLTLGFDDQTSVSVSAQVRK